MNLEITLAEVTVVKMLLESHVKAAGDPITVAERTMAWEPLLTRIAALEASPVATRAQESPIPNEGPKKAIVPIARQTGPELRKVTPLPQAKAPKKFGPEAKYVEVVAAAATFDKGDRDIVKVLADEFPTMRTTDISAVLARQSKYIAELRELPMGNARNEYLRRVFGLTTQKAGVP